MSSDRDPVFDVARSSDDGRANAVHHPVIVVGAGTVGLVAAIDLAQYGIATIVLDEGEAVRAGSCAICYAKRSVEILDRLGCGEAVVREGVGWNVGKVFFKDRQVYSFNMLSDAGHRRPAFVNLQQYCLEEILVERARTTGRVDLRWRSRVVAIDDAANEVRVVVDTLCGRAGPELRLADRL